MTDYAGHGLTSSADFDQPCGVLFGHPCAFPGVNPDAPPLPFLQTVGRSVYNGLQAKLTGNLQHPLPGMHALNFQVSYALSRFENDGGASGPPATAVSADQDFGPQALDYAKLNRYFGPSVLDRTHQLSFGGYADLPRGFQLSLIAHFWSPLSTSLVDPIPTSDRARFSAPTSLAMAQSRTLSRGRTGETSAAASTPRISTRCSRITTTPTRTRRRRQAMC
jgi:hypothetical protein